LENEIVLHIVSQVNHPHPLVYFYIDEHCEERQVLSTYPHSKIECFSKCVYK